MKTVFSTRILPESSRKILIDEGWKLSEFPYQRTCTEKEIIEGAKEADALICMISETIDANIMDQLPKLKLISNYAVGFNNIDVDAATKRGILVGNTPGVLTESTAELAMALMISWSKNIVTEQQRVKDGAWKNWNPLEYLGTELYEKKLGIIGLGRIGKCFAKMASLGLGMEVLSYSKHINDEDVNFPITHVNEDQLLAESDFISLHVPLNQDTNGFFNQTKFLKMKNSAVLINTARGQVVNQGDLTKAIKEGSIAGAALDVTDPEPLPPNHELLRMDNVLITPHIGSATTNARIKMGNMAAKNVILFSNSRNLGNFVNSPN